MQRLVFQVGELFLCGNQYLAILQGIDVIYRRGEHTETLPVAHPPVFHSEPYDMLYASVIDRVLAHSAFYDKNHMLTNVAFMGKELFLFYRSGCKRRLNEFEFLIRDFKPRFAVYKCS